MSRPEPPCFLWLLKTLINAGLELELADPHSHAAVHGTVVMKTNNYFQLHALPGVWDARIKPQSRGSAIYPFDDAAPVILGLLQGRSRGRWNCVAKRSVAGTAGFRRCWLGG